MLALSKLSAFRFYFFPFLSSANASFASWAFSPLGIHFDGFLVIFFRGGIVAQIA